jgi:hypothetical protein
VPRACRQRFRRRSAVIKAQEALNPNACLTPFLFVSLSADENSLRAYFSQFGTVTTAEVKRSPEGRSRGFGFINFSALTRDGERSLFRNPHALDGRDVEVLPPRPADAAGAGGPPRGGGPPPGVNPGPFRGGLRAGDWYCAQCGNDNFSWRTECKQCGCPKAAGGVAAAPGGGGRGGGAPPYAGGNRGGWDEQAWGGGGWGPGGGGGWGGGPPQGYGGGGWGGGGGWDAGWGGGWGGGGPGGPGGWGGGPPMGGPPPDNGRGGGGGWGGSYGGGQGGYGGQGGPGGGYGGGYDSGRGSSGRR